MTSSLKQGLISFVALTFMVSLIYAITGILGLGLATGSQYSTAIWIPSGIALGATLVYGLRALPAVFLGSLIVNYYNTINITFSYLEIEPLLVGCIIGTGAVLQAYIGYQLVKKWIGFNNHLNEPNNILLFAFLTGPISCLTNATTSNLALMYLGILPLQNFFVSWFTWYIGDSVGVLIFTPIFLILFAAPRDIWRNRVIPILLPLSASFVIVSLIYSILRVNSVLQDQLWFVLVCGYLFCILVNITLFIINGQKNLMQMQMREILRSAGEGIIGIDENEKVIFVNPAALNMWGITEDEFVGKQIHDCLPFDPKSRHAVHDRACPFYLAYKINKTSQITNILLTRKDNTSIWIEYTCSPLVVSDRTIGAVIVSADITRRRESEHHLESLAHFDILTGFPNRSRFIETLTSLTQSANNENLNFAVCFLDIDNFKLVNDNLGHNVGDIALQSVSLMIASNIDEADYFARLGGDEFGIILHGKTHDQINEMATRLINAVSRPIEIKGHILNLTISLGIATYPKGGITSDELIKNADIAMYHAKEAGKHTFAHFSMQLSQSMTRLHLIETEMNHAIAKNELSLVYQPQIEVSTGKISGLEVLLRWNNRILGSIPPGEFIPIAERNRLIHSLGEWVLQRLAEESVHIKEIYCDNLTFSINVSVLQLESERFHQNLIEVLQSADLKDKLTLEITETAVMTNPEDTINKIKDIRKLGVHFSLDDFGIHYSSMRYLKNLPISELKIDYIFIKDVLHDKNDKAIVNTILQLSNNLDIAAIAEGVETKAQYEVLKDMGCEYMQGFYFYKPMPLNELLAALKSKR